MDLDKFLANKAQLAHASGFDTDELPEFLYPFQRALTEWSLKLGCGLLLANCGLGKTPISLAWSQKVVERTNKPVLIFTPLAVGPQFVDEGEKFGIPVKRSRDGSVPGEVVVTNYEAIAKFNPDDFGGVVCDESSIVKNFNGKRRTEVTEFLRTIPYRLMATATPSPNDYNELGTSAEALGHLGYMDMLAYFFINDEHSLHPTSLGAKWRFKKAAEDPFWRWVCSWARAVRKPSDLGFDDTGFDLPPLTVNEQIVQNTRSPAGVLPGIEVEARTLAEQREERKLNMPERCELAGELATSHNDSAIIWTDYNEEARRLEEMIPGALQISGSMREEVKEERFRAFQDGELRVLITKPKIGAWGLNLQVCNRVIFFVSHSFEQYYQAIRRCWRFGQTRPVTVDVIATPGERRVLANLKRKHRQSDRMFDQLVKQMNDPIHLGAQREAAGNVEVPSWLT